MPALHRSSFIDLFSARHRVSARHEAPTIFFACRLGQIVMVCFTLFGCANIPGIDLPSTAKQVDSAEEYRILTELKQKDSTIASFRGLARVTIESNSERTDLRYIILLQRPDSIRLEALPTLGAFTLSVLAGRAGQANYIEPAQRRAMRSTESATLLGRVLGTPLKVEDLLSFLSGTIPNGMLRQDGTRVLDGDSSNLFMVGPNGSFTFELDAGSLRPKRASIANSFDDTESIGLKYTWPSEQSEFNLPSEVFLSIRSGQILLTLKFSKNEINPKIKSDFFNLTIPPGYSVEEF